MCIIRTGTHSLCTKHARRCKKKRMDASIRTVNIATYIHVFIHAYNTYNKTQHVQSLQMKPLQK